MKPNANALLLLLSLYFVCEASARAFPSAPGPSLLAAFRRAPRVGEAAPTFKLGDTAGRRRSLAEFRGRRVALFVVCGCSWCYAAAREWAAAQRSGAVFGAASASSAGGSGSGAGVAPPPITLVAGSGMEAKGCRNFAAHTGLDPAQTVLLPDPDRTVAEAYHAEPCPRVYIIDASGSIRYLNQGKDDGPRKAPAAVIVAHAVAALRGARP